MGLIEIARDTLKEIPMADILRERLSLALDQFLVLERKVSELQTKVGNLESKLEIVTLDRDKTQQELNRLKEEHIEEILIHRCIEFRRGRRTAGKWAAFCPKCHLPVANQEGYLDVICSDRVCNWFITLDNMSLSQVMKELEM